MLHCIVVDRDYDLKLAKRDGKDTSRVVGDGKPILFGHKEEVDTPARQQRLASVQSVC